MPLNKKGKKIMNAMKARYGDEKGEQVFYASKNKGKLTDVEKKKLALEARATKKTPKKKKKLTQKEAIIKRG